MNHNSGFLRRLFAGVTAAAAAAALAVFPASAAINRTMIGYQGDLNGDAMLTVTDIVRLSRHLTGAEPISDTGTARLADINADHVLDSADLTLQKHLLLSGAEPEVVCDEAELPDAPVSLVKPTLTSLGEARILMFAVNFTDCVHRENYSTEQIWELAFGPQDPESPAYPLESISAYYERASYGRLHITGDVYQYTTRYSSDSYVNNFEKLLDEIMEAMDSEIDYRQYDGNGDAVMDTVLVALPGDADKDDWWPCSGGYYGRKEFDGVMAGNLCIGSWALSDYSGFNSTWVHELGHAMGLPDYYRYVNYDDDGAEGLRGDAGWEMMDDAFGDMSAFSKLMYGWITEDEVQMYTGGTQTFTLQTCQDVPDCILIPHRDDDDLYAEYFIVELNTPDLNNASAFYEDFAYPMFFESGVRVLHCDAEVWYGYMGYEFKWNNYGQNYDESNEKQRVIRLVNNSEAYFGSGSVINENTPGFAWYDRDGYAKDDPGVTISVDSISEDGRSCTITISEK